MRQIEKPTGMNAVNRNIMRRLLSTIVGMRSIVAHGEETPFRDFKTVRFAVGCSRFGEIWFVEFRTVKIDISLVECDHITRKPDYALDQFPVLIVRICKRDDISPVRYRIPEQIRQPPASDKRFTRDKGVHRSGRYRV